MQFEAELRTKENRTLVKVSRLADGTAVVWTRNHRRHALTDGDGFQTYGNLLPLEAAELAEYLDKVATALRAT